jgi:DUF4097 and DUF4098 domain-containing protein YvlB
MRRTVSAHSFYLTIKPKIMKNILFILACIITLNMQAQKTFTQNVNAKKAEKVTLDFQFADDITIETWNKDEVFVEAVVSIDDNKHNDKFKFELREIGDEIIIEAEIEDLDKLGEETKVRHKDGDTYTYNSRTVDLDINYTVKVPQKMAVALKTINGNIKVEQFNNALALKTISGDIEMKMDAKKGCDLIMKTISGDMYTDFDIKTAGKSNFFQFASSINTEINGGGFPIDLNTISGNIYLRKK